MVTKKSKSQKSEIKSPVIKVQVTMTLEQAHQVMRAMDLYSRLLMGQFEELKWLFCGFGEEAATYNRDSDHWHRDMESLCLAMKRIVYPTLDTNAYWGITGYSERNKCPPQATLVYDVYKTMDYAISWFKQPEGPRDLSLWTVNFDKPMHFYTDLPLPEVKCFKE